MKRKAVFFLALWCAAACVAGDRTKTFTAGKGGRLDVTIGGGDITVRSWEKDEVRVDIRNVDDEQDPGIVMSQSGSTVTVETRGASSEGCTLEIRVPSRFDIRLQSSSGDIDIGGPLAGKIRGTTGGGNIRLGDLGGTIEMRTSGGDIGCGDIGGDLDLFTSGGDITMGAVTNLADRLINAGFASRERGTEDRRVVKVQLTDEGRKVLEKAVEAGARN